MVDGLFPSPAAAIALVMVPAGSNLNSLTLTGIEWPAVGNLTGYVVFASQYDDTISAAATGTLTAGAGDTYTPTSITFTGDAPLAGWGMPNPNVAQVLVKIKPLIHAGPAGVAVTSVATNTLVCSELIDSHASPVNWTGRACSIIGRPNASTPFASFNITAFVASTGTLTLDRDPTGIVLAGDALVIRCQADDLTSTPTLVTVVDDAAYQNVTNGYAGLTANAEIGDLIRIIAGTGRGQLPSTITANTSTGYTFQPALLMDNTSIWIIEGPTWQNQANTTVVSNLTPGNPSSLTVPTVNYIDQPVLIGSFLVDVNGNVSPEGDMTFREDWIYGEVGAPSGEMKISIPGTLAIGSNLGPAAFYTSTVSLQNGVTCMVKQAPVGADLVIQVYAGTTLLFTVTIAAGSTVGSATGTPAIGPETPIIINLTAVGTTFPGSDLTVALS